MNAKELAEKLNGMEYPVKVSEELISEAISSGLVIVHGYSDDGMELRGFFADEYGCYDGSTFKLNRQGIIINECDDERCPYYREAMKEARHQIEAIWDADGYSWIYQTDIPHETFDVLEDGEKYCRGIVFNVDDLK